jgi:hypothetical protein
VIEHCAGYGVCCYGLDPSYSCRLCSCGPCCRAIYIVCASSGKDYDFQVIVQIGSKLRQANAGVRECGEFM